MADTASRTEVTTERRQLFGTFAYLMGNQGSTALLGLAFWVFVTHFFRASDVGLAFAASSTATLLSTVGVLGVATFLIAELGAMAPSTRRVVLSTGMTVVGTAVGIITLGTLAFSHSFGRTLAAIGGDPVLALLFLAGSVATVVALTFDSAAIGIHRGSAQLTRGILASVLKFAVVVALILADNRTGAGLVFAWVAGVIVSLFACHPLLKLGRTPPGEGSLRARVRVARRYSMLSLNHHVLNLSINSVSYFVPVVAALLIEPRQYAFFATAQTLSSVVLIVPFLLTLALFAETSNDVELLQRHVRRTLPLGMAAAVIIVGVVALGAPLGLRVFGSLYAVHGTAVLRILILTGPSYVIKDHYVAIRRTQGQLGLATRVLALGTSAEVAGAAVGGAVFGLYGLCTGWVVVAALEALALLPTVLRVCRGDHRAACVPAGSPGAPRPGCRGADGADAADGSDGRGHSGPTGAGAPGSVVAVPARTRRAVLPRPDGQVRPLVALDPNLAVLLMRVPGYPLHHGGVGAVRSLGRAGVPVYAVVEDRFTPAALSRYLTGSIVSRRHDAEDTGRLVDRVMSFGQTLDRPCLVVCTDDAAAVVVAEHAEVLGPRFVLPAVAPELPRQVADKHWLFEFCRAQGLPAPATALVDTGDDLERVAFEMRFPLVVKSTALRDNAFTATARHGGVVHDEGELHRLWDRWTEPYRVVVQEYLPDEVCEDWIVHGYCDGGAEMKLAFSGRKVRSWPPRTGATARAFVRTNDELLDLTASLCARIGYRGIFDLDWRLDHRTGAYNLLDFNPRLGAQFRMFDDDAGLDVIRAMHLDMSGRRVPVGRVCEHRSFVVEPFDLASRWTERHGTPSPALRLAPTGGARLAWSAWDDPLPALAMAARQLAQSVGPRLRGGLRTPAGHDPGPRTPAAAAGAGPWPDGSGANGSGAHGSGANGSGANGSGAVGSGAVGSGANGSGANGSGAVGSASLAGRGALRTWPRSPGGRGPRRGR